MTLPPRSRVPPRPAPCRPCSGPRRSLVAGPGARGGALAAALACLLCGCIHPLGPDHRRPELDLPAAFRGEAGEAGGAGGDASLADLPWWEVFRDPELSRLIGEALGHNLGLEEALDKVAAYRARALGAGAALGPGLSGTLQGSQRRGQATTPTLSVPKGPIHYFSGTLQVAWELDLWGRLRRAREAGEAALEGSIQAQRAAQVALVAEVAGAYFVLRQLDEQLDIARQTERNYQHTHDIYAMQLAGGTANRVPVATALAQLSDARATARDLARQIVGQENSLSVLLGRPPGAIARPGPLATQAELPQVPAGLPAELVGRRPDILQAEADLRQAGALVGVAKGNLLPSISLTGLLGLASTHLENLLNGTSHVWSLGGQGLGQLPLFAGARLRHELDATWADRRAAQRRYRAAVLAALGEVATALNDTHVQREVARSRQSQVDALSQALALAMDRYRGGVSSYLEVTTTQNSLFPARLLQVAQKAQQHVAMANLYKALGGGWGEERVPSSEG